MALASNWTNLPSMIETTSMVEFDWPHNRIPDATDGAEPTPFTSRLSLSSDINFTEFVEVNIKLHHSSFRGPGDHAGVTVRYRVDTFHYT